MVFGSPPPCLPGWSCLMDRAEVGSLFGEEPGGVLRMLDFFLMVARRWWCWGGVVVVVLVLVGNVVV